MAKDSRIRPSTQHSSALSWLDSLQGSGIRPGLGRMRALLDALGRPQRTVPSILVAGTNGKGSTTFMISALLHARGLSVGTFTSPHVETINERIRWNLEPIDDETFADVITDLSAFEPLLGDRRPSYFELVTAGALQWFADSVVDVAVVEVGALGRFDATNVLTPAITAMTIRLTTSPP